MPKKTDAPAYEPEATYRARLTRVVTFAGALIRPLFPIEATGETLNQIVAQEGADAIDTAERL